MITLVPRRPLPSSNPFQNERKNYNKVVEELGSRDALVLQRWYTALTPCVSLISPTEMRELVHQIFAFSFASPLVAVCTDEEQNAAAQTRLVHAVHAHCNFLIYLVSANADFLTAALRHLSQNLAYRAELHTMLDSLHDLVHGTLLNICRCVPAASSALFPFLLDAYPHKSHPVTSHKVFLKNLLRISEYAPELRDRILETIVDRLIQIDVEIKAPDERSGGGAESDDMFAFESFDDVEGDESAAAASSSSSSSPRHAAASSASPSKAHAVAAAVQVQREMTEKLDALMQLMFQYLTIVRDGSEALCDEVFSSLLRTFDRSILVTHKVRR